MELYCSEGKDAWNLIRENGPALKRSLLLHVYGARMEWFSLRGRSALVVAASCDDVKEKKKFLRRAERDGNQLIKEVGSSYYDWGILLKAGIAATRGNIFEALELLGEAEAGFEVAGVGLHAAVSRRRRGQLLGGDDSLKLIASADEWMVGQGIKNPERMSAMLAPGRWQH